MVAIGAGVAGPMGSLVFASSLGQLVEEPARDGWNWDYELALGDELSDDEALEQASALRDDPRIESAFYARLATRDLAGLPTVVFGVEPIVGELNVTIVDGRPVQADDEIVLGRTTLDALDARVGGSLRVEVDGRPRELRVVGQGLFPTNENDDPAAGAVVTLATLAGLRGSGGFPDLFFTVAPASTRRAAGRSGGADRHHHRHGRAAGGEQPRAGGRGALPAGRLPRSARPRRRHPRPGARRARAPGRARDAPRAGVDRRQAATTVVAHSLTVAVVGVAVGLPIGLAVGRLSWRVVAGDLGFATDPQNPLLALAVAVAAAAGDPARPRSRGGTPRRRVLRVE